MQLQSELLIDVRTEDACGRPTDASKVKVELTHVKGTKWKISAYTLKDAHNV